MLHEPFGPHGAEEETEELWTDLSEVPETAYEQDPKRRSTAIRICRLTRRCCPPTPAWAKAAVTHAKSPRQEAAASLPGTCCFYWCKAVIPG